MGRAVAMTHSKDGRARYNGCDVNHNHNDDCRLEAVTS